MIELTRLNGNPLVVNSDLIKWAEAAPDTMLTLINGEKVVVLESCPEVVERIIAHRARLLAEVARLAPEMAPRLAVSAAALAGSGSQSDAIEVDMEAAQRRRRQEP